MIPFYHDYVWKEGRPYGLHKVESGGNEKVYRIVADPYRKWISVEAYMGRAFERVVYDSRILDFRKLTPTDQAAWRKEAIDEESAWIFNEDDRLILREQCLYREGVCREIKIYSPYQTLACLYVMPEGPLGTITLYDSNTHVVHEKASPTCP